jgi:preprotein translocase SecE subunit
MSRTTIIMVVFNFGRQSVPDEKRKKRVRKSPETVRERTAKADSAVKKPRRLRRSASTFARPLKTIHRTGKKEYYLPLPDNRAGRFLNKRRHIVPRYFREAWAELRLVVWPGRRETWKLTLAVFIFAIIFSLLVAITDYGLDKIFKRILV